MNLATPLLHADQLQLHMAGRPILHPIQCRIPAHSMTAIIGPNGAGKSSLMRCLGGLAPYSGSVQLQGVEIRQLSSRQRSQRISWLAQNENPTGLDDLRVEDIVLLGRLPHQGLLATSSQADAQAAQLALTQTGGQHLHGRLFGQLSGGERQKILLARALAVQAPLLLMDEPLNHLDPPHQADWLALMQQLCRSGQTVVAVLHDINFALRADHILVMADGRLHHAGPSHAAATHRAIEAVFEERLEIAPFRQHWLALPR